MQSYQQSGGYLPPKATSNFCSNFVLLKFSNQPAFRNCMSFLQEVVQLSLAFTTVYHLGLDEVELRFSRLHDNMKTAFLSEDPIIINAGDDQWGCEWRSGTGHQASSIGLSLFLICSRVGKTAFLQILLSRLKACLSVWRIEAQIALKVFFQIYSQERAGQHWKIHGGAEPDKTDWLINPDI